MPDDATDDLPAIGNPARRALSSIGVTGLAQLTTYREGEIAALHGVGPKAIRILRQALADEGLSFGD